MRKILLITFLVLFPPFSFALSDNEQLIEAEKLCRSDWQLEKVDSIVKPFYENLEILYASDGQSYLEIFMDIIVFGRDGQSTKNILLLYNQSLDILFNAYNTCIESGVLNSSAESELWKSYRNVQKKLRDEIKLYIKNVYNPSVENE